MTHFQAEGAATSSAHSRLNELPKTAKKQKAALPLVSRSIDDQMALAEAYGYQSMDEQATIEAFETNKENIDKLVPIVAQKVAEAKVEWDKLIPWLCRQRALLSQRGSDRREVLNRANLPAWQPYFKTVVSSMNSTISTVYYHMRRLEGAKAGTGPKPKPRLLTAPERHSLAMKIAKAQQLAKEVLTSPGVRPKAVEQLAREVLGLGQEAAPAGPKIKHEAYGRELNHWKETTNNFLRAVNLALGSKKETETCECLIRYLKRRRTTAPSLKM